MRDQVLKWIHENDYQTKLIEYLKLPSRSNNRDECRISTMHVIELLKNAGLIPQIFETQGNPIVVASNKQKEGNPTILIYGHHDVQPEGDLDDWDTDPFEPVLRDGKLFARGSADNKGQHFAHIMAIQFLYENYREIFDSVNIKLILDGDEELGSPTMRPFVLNHKDLLAADFILISDGPSLVKNGPTLVGSVRGIVSFQITISHNQSDLHSGNFGGVARSATLDLKNLLDSMVDTEGYVTIEGFYNDIEDQSELEKSALVDLESIYDDNIVSYGITRAIRTKGHSNPFLNQAWPTLNINGLSAGGVGNKRRTIIPQKAIASIDCRLVYAQDPEAVMGLIKKHITTWAEIQGIQSAIELETENFMAPPPSSLGSEYIDLVKTAVAKGFQKEPKLVPRLGGSLPTSLFPEILERPAILFPMSLPDSRNHGPNENLDIEFLEFGIVSSVFILADFAKDTNR